MNLFNNNEKGILLIEILVGMLVMTIILFVFVPLSTYTRNAVTGGNSKNELLQQGRWALSLMARDISASDLIITPSPSSNASSLVFQRYDTTGYITYSLNSQRSELQRQIGANTPHPLNNGDQVTITNVNFSTGPLGENVTITLTLRLGDTTESLQRTVFLLNNQPGIGGN